MKPRLPKSVRILAAFVVTLPLMVACPDAADIGTSGGRTGGKTPAPSGPKASGSPGASASPGTGSGSPSPDTSGSPTTSGGLDQNTDRNPTPTPLASATSVPTEIPVAVGDTVKSIVYGVAPSGLIMAAGGRGYAILPGSDKLGEFPSAFGDTPFDYPAGVTGLVAAAADGNDNVWTAGGTSKTIVKLTGAKLTAGTPIALGFTPAKLAADAQRVWVAGSGGEGLAVTGGATASVAFGAAPAFLVSDGNGGAWAADSSSNGVVRLYPAPGGGPADPVQLGGEIAAACTGDSGGLWAVLKGTSGGTPKLVHHPASGSESTVDLSAGEVPYGLASGGAGKAWVLTDKALYQVDTKLSGLVAIRHERTETWIPAGLASDPEDRRKVYAADTASKSVRTLKTGAQ